ncbi:hypothetical protein F2Q65_07230 [Thiohalocapsa marina]|uniref:Chemotaxis methyl-accepting receptor HlyB-like 4HB MCP domain-containing protein n=1 Tax=Thiohalocapsa marina TaxID=424902 RepID=A0A5M8FQ12_9GAMM|nr:hypothetical protein [Thiohalocapsa marina]KAA6185786.1 hypothetical protein F2Q65_07230 [Thiohalocapsa marina]
MTFTERSQDSRTLIRLVGFVLLLVLLNSIAGLVAIRYTHTSYQEALAQLRDLAETRDLARSAQIQFKIQVQEWKNTLLRGNDADDLQRYRAAFEQRSKTVSELLAKLREHAATAELPEADIDDLLRRHAAMLASYRQALAPFTENAGQTPRETDQQVRGIDRRLAVDIDRIGDMTNTRALTLQQRLEQASRERYETVFLYSVIANLLVAALVLLILLTSLSAMRQR